MKDYPSIPRLENAPDGILDAGHLWLLEKVDGANFRFQLDESGYVRFGTRNRVYDDPDAVPAPYQHAVRHVREQFDRDALRTAVDDVEDVVFFGEAMHRHTIEYDWDRTPSFLGFDVWSGSTNSFRPLSSIERIFEELGLQAVNVFEREKHVRDFDPETYTIPESNWYDGPAEGVVVRNKTGGRAKLLHPRYREVDETVPVDGTADQLASKFATNRRFEKLIAKLEGREQSVTFDVLYDRVLEDIVREEHKTLYEGHNPVDMGEFRSEVAELTRSYLDEYRG